MNYNVAVRHCEGKLISVQLAGDIIAVCVVAYGYGFKAVSARSTCLKIYSFSCFVGTDIVTFVYRAYVVEEMNGRVEIGCQLYAVRICVYSLYGYVRFGHCKAERLLSVYQGVFRGVLLCSRISIAGSVRYLNAFALITEVRDYGYRNVIFGIYIHSLFAGKVGEGDDTAVLVIILIAVCNDFAFFERNAVYLCGFVGKLHNNRAVTERYIDLECVVAVTLRIDTTVASVESVVLADILRERTRVMIFVISETVAQTQALYVFAFIGLYSERYRSA